LVFSTGFQVGKLLSAKSDFGNITLELNGSRYSVFPMMKQKYFFGSLDFEQRDLPTIKTLYNYNLQHILGDADFRDSEIENLGNLITIGGNAELNRSKVKDLGNLKTIGGDVTFGSFGKSELKHLGGLTTIGGDANFSGSSIKDLGNLTQIGGNAYFENSEVENLGNLTTIKGNTTFSKSNIKDLNNLTTINGNANFINSEVRYLRKLTTIGGYAYFQDSKIIHLGNLRSVSSVEGKESLAYKLWIKRKKDIKEGKFENGGYLIPDLLSSQQVENKLGRELHWWNDDIVYLSGTKYKKVYLRPEYKKVI
jgi:hypothetical protein